MNFKLTIDLNQNNFIDVFNFLDQRNIDIEFDQEQLFNELISEENYMGIDFFIDRGTLPLSFIKYCDVDLDENVIKFLLEKIIDDDFGKTFDYLINHAKNSIIEFYLSRFVPKEKIKKLVNSNDGKALIDTSRSGNIELIKLLIKNGANIHKCSIDPIIIALENNNINTLEYLLSVGSNCESILPKHIRKCLLMDMDDSIKFIRTQIDNGKLNHLQMFNLFECIEAAIKKKSIKLVFSFINFIDIGDEHIEKYIKISEKINCDQLTDVFKSLKKNYTDPNIYYDKYQRSNDKPTIKFNHKKFYLDIDD